MSIDFEIKNSKTIEGLKIIEPSVSTDSRGNIWTSFLKEELDSLLPEDLIFKHDKFSLSENNVLRGIHGDNKSWKLVTCVYGEVMQVVVDLRKDSLTYQKWEKFLVSKDNQILILLPPGLGNAYYVLSHQAVYHYKLAYNGEYFDSNEQFTYKWDDERLDIDWPVKKPILSPRDNFSD